MNSKRFSTFLLVLLLGISGASCSDDSTGDNSTEFCSSLRILSSPNSALTNLTFDDPKLVNQTVADLLELASQAPSSISEETYAVVSLYEDILSKLVSVSPSQRTVELRNFQNELDGVTTAARALELYGETECDLVFISPFDSRTTPVPSEDRE